MRRVTDFAQGSEVHAAALNRWQDEETGLIPATHNPAGSRALVGMDGRYVTTPDVGVAHGTLAVLDTSVDWRHRALTGVLLRLEAAAQRLHGADAWQANDPQRPVVTRRFEGRTGTGALAAGGAPVANGTPPVQAAGSFAVVIDARDPRTATRAYLYARPTDGALCLYNALGVTLHADLFVYGSSTAPTPGAPLPSPVPTLTDLLWLTPTTFAARPVNPGADVRGVHYATDTGEVALWDGGAWRVLASAGGGGGLPVAAGANAVPLSTGPGSAYTARSLAELRALLLGPFVDPRTGAGWLAAPATGGASATWADNKLLLDCDVTSVGSCGVESIARLPSTDAYDFAIRLRIDLGDGSGDGRVLLALGRDSANCLVLTVGANGALQAGRTDGGVYTGYTLLLAVAELDAAARTGGELWVRAARSAQGFAWLWGIGAGGQLPLRWEEWWSSVPLSASAGYNFVQRAHALSQGPFVGVYGATVGALDFEVTVLDLVAGLPGAFGGA